MAGWLWVYLLGYLPQTLLLMYASLGLAGIRSRLGRLVVPALPLGLAALLLRQNLPIQWYVPAQLVAFTGGLVLFRLASPLGAIAASAIGFILIALGDLLVVAPLIYLLNLDPAAVTQDWLTYVLLGSLEGIFVLAAAVAVRLGNLSLLPISRWENVLAERSERRDGR